MRALWALSGALLLLAGCGTRSEKGIVLERSLEEFIPGDSVVLMGMRVEQITNTAVYQKLAEGRTFTELDTFVKRTKLDPRKDIQELLLASNGKEMLALAKGRINDPEALMAALEKEGAKRTVVGKYTLVGSDDGAVVFIDKTIALAARTEHLKKVLTEKGDDSSKQELLRQVKDVEHEKHLWAVAIGGFAPLPLPETGNMANLGRVFGSLQRMTMTMDLNDGVAMAATGQCKEEKDAKQLHDMMRALIGFGRLSTGTNQPEMLRFFDGVKVDHTDRMVKVNADVPLNLLETFLRAGKKPAAREE